MTKSQRTCLFITLMAGTMMSSMTITSTSIMLPSIIQAFGVSTVTAQWLTSGASLTSGIMIPIAAYLIKRFPSKHYFIAAMMIYSFGSLLGAVALSFPILLLGRLIQAVGCGMLLSFSQIVIMTIFPRENHGTVMGIFSLGATFAPVVAPSIAGLVVDQLGWQSMFTIFCVIGALITILGFIFMKNVTETYLERFHLLPVLLSSVGFCGLLIGFGNISGSSLLRLETGGALLIGLLSLTAFVILQLRSDNPYLNLRIFSYPMFRTSVIISILMYLICMGSGTLLPIFAQSVLKYSATAYALVTLPGSLIMAVVTVLAGRLYDKAGARPLFISGVIMLVAGSILGVMINNNSGLLHIGVVSCLLSAGTGFFNSPVTAMGLSNLEGRNRVDGSSVLNTLRQISSSLASTFAIVIYTMVGAQSNDYFGVKVIYICYLGFSILTILAIVNFLKNSRSSA